MSMTSINHNMLAVNTANNLSKHYSNLATSTQKLSSGLRINNASDDAAGLAIRELQRADIAALRQGMRNVNDAISMVQTFDGALAIIDEKLIRMKELAEQAATGTYDSTQRLMIDSEFQAMGAEIDRIARATDFNGIKLIDGVGLAGRTRINARADAAALPPPADFDVQGPDGRYYKINLDNSVIKNIPAAGTATKVGDWDTSGITDPAKLLNKGPIQVTNVGIPTLGGKYVLVTPSNGFNTIPDNAVLKISYGLANQAPPFQASMGWAVGYNGGAITPVANGNIFGFSWGNGSTIGVTLAVIDPTTGNTTTVDYPPPTTALETTMQKLSVQDTFKTNFGNLTATQNGNILKLALDLGDNNTITQEFDLQNGSLNTLASVTFNLDIQDVTDSPTDPGIPELFKDKVKIHFGTLNDSAEDYYYINKHDATIKGLGLNGVNVKTQDKAQSALVDIKNAIVKKDEIRAEYGAMQNRLENTYTNLSIQAENLQAAESRISDADIAIEMMTFVKNQILSQSAVAMLAQANSMPQMVMRLIN